MAKNDDFLDLDALDEFEEVKEEKPNDEFEDIVSVLCAWIFYFG